MATFTCPQCKKVFSRDHSNAIYCSFACRGLAQRARKNIVCENCAAEFTAQLSLLKKGNVRFCSRKCYEIGRERIPLAKRFWAKVDKKGANECWLWLGVIDAKGYGKISIREPVPPRGAHRVSYELTYGSIPKGQQINHKCDVRACVNPRHLYAGTAKQNTRDAIYRNRLATGERHGRVKLTLKQVQEIRERFRNGETNAMRLAKEYAVGDTQIRRIVRGQKWRNAPIP